MNEITGDSGEIVSPLFPSTYIITSGQQVLHTEPSWRITVDAGAKILVQFSVFEIGNLKQSNS